MGGNWPAAFRWLTAVGAGALLLLGHAAAQAQTSITISNLASNGFDNRPASLQVSGVPGFSGMVLSDVRYTAAAGAWQANGGNINVYGFNYNVTSATWQQADQQILVKGSLVLPPFLLDANGQQIASAASFLIDPKGVVTIGGLGGTITFPTIKIPPKSPRLSIENTSVTIDTAEKSFEGSVSVGVGLGPAGNPCPPFTAGPPLWSGNIKFIGGKLDTIGLGVSGLAKPLGTTGAFLDSVNGSVGNLSTGDNTWTINAGLSCYAGCPITINGSDVYPVVVTANGTVTGAGYIEITGTAAIFNIAVGGAYFRYNPPYSVAAGAFVDFLDIYMANANISITANSFAGDAEGKLQIPRYIPILGGYELAKTSAWVNNNGFGGQIQINIIPEIPSACTPRWCPPKLCPGRPCWCCWCKWCWQPPCIPSLCTPRIPAVTLKGGFQFVKGKFSFVNSLAYLAKDDMVEPWEKSYRYVVTDEATGNQMAFMNNWTRQDKTSTGSHGRKFDLNARGNPVTTFTVADGQDSEIFRLTYSNTNITSVQMTLQMPDGQTLDINGGPKPYGYTNEPGSYGEVALDRGEAFFVIAKPKAGQYTNTILNWQSLGSFAVEQLDENIDPVVAVTGIQQTSPGIYDVSYNTTLAQGSPQTTIYLSHVGTDHTRMSGPAYQLATFPSVNGAGHYVIDTRVMAGFNIPADSYRVVVDVNDPASAEVEAVSDSEITVDNSLSPAPPTHIETGSGNHSFSVSWTPSVSTNVDNYLVRYTAKSLPVDFEYEQTVGMDATNATVTGLTNGQPYLVTVVAVSGDGYESPVGEIERVAPSVGFDMDPPLITSAPNVGATASEPYVYVPETFDADDRRAPVSAVFNGPDQPDDDAAVDENGLYWELVSGPAGMTIDRGDGIVMWTPATNQVGDFNVTIRATKEYSTGTNNPVPHPLAAEQTYTLTVVPADNLSSLKPNNFAFLSRPSVTAYENETYNYTPVVITSSTNYSIVVLEGPTNMTVVLGSNNLETVTWPVPAGAIGQRVRLLAYPNVANESEADNVYQEFWLSVVNGQNQIPQPIVITDIEKTPGGVELIWSSGNQAASSFQVQRTQDLINGPWVNVGSPMPAEPVNYYLETNTPAGSAYFYRAVGQTP